jgi:hypothetical protein
MRTEERKKLITDMVDSNACETEVEAAIYADNVEAVECINRELADDEDFLNWFYQQPEAWEKTNPLPVLQQYNDLCHRRGGTGYILMEGR